MTGARHAYTPFACNRQQSQLPAARHHPYCGPSRSTLQFRSTITLGRLSPSAAAHANGTPLSGSLMSLLIVWSLIEHPPVITRRIGAFFGADPGPFASTSLRSACNKSGAAALDHGVSVSETRRESGVGRSVAGAIQARPMLARGCVYASRVRLTIGHIAAIYADASGKDGASRDHGSDSVDMGDPQGPLRRVGLPLTNGDSPGGSWHGGSVPITDLGGCSKPRVTEVRSTRSLRRRGRGAKEAR